LKKIIIVIGTRPNFIKVTRFKKVAQKMYFNLEIKFVHTGQHFDEKMSKIFFEQLDLKPDYMLNIGQGTANTQMAQVMLGLEKVCIEYQPDLVMVVGDVNSTFAAALTANKMGIKIAHLESGLRSFDHDMPEEINRILTDKITDYFFVTEKSGLENLEKEGIAKKQVFLVGNTMIDSLVEFTHEINKSDVLNEYHLTKGKFVLMTMHRPSNVDSLEGLKTLLDIIDSINDNYHIVFPIHPRTIAKLKSFDLYEKISNNSKLNLCEPLDYFSFQKLTAECAFVVTDSGGIQEETTYRQIPCLTLRNNTERPITIEVGSNQLVEYNVESIHREILKIKNGTYKKGTIPELWDGKSTERVLEVIEKVLNQ
jgi:UDP-N-acetylglucosamine 2-epimerase (non-hydrolysing)